MTVLKKATIKSYDAAGHKATVQIAGSLAVWLDAVRVATNIDPSAVVAGRQCSVLFLDPSNQDDAVIITIHGALPSATQILVATATADLTLTTSAQSITGDGNSSKVRILLPTAGDWLSEAICDFVRGADPTPGNMIGELFVNDSGSAETAAAIVRHSVQSERTTAGQRWKVTTTVANTPVELKARMDAAGGNGTAKADHTRLVASGIKGPTGIPLPASLTVVAETAFGQASAAGSASTHSRGDHTHGTPADPVPAHAAIVDAHAMLAAANVWTALQTFNADIKTGEIRNLNNVVAIRLPGAGSVEFKSFPVHIVNQTLLVTGGADAIQLRVKAFAGQTADIFQVQDDAAASLFGVTLTYAAFLVPPRLPTSGVVQAVNGDTTLTGGIANPFTGAKDLVSLAHLRLIGGGGFAPRIQSSDAVTRAILSTSSPHWDLYGDLRVNTITNNQGLVLSGPNPGMQWVNTAVGGKTLRVLNVSGDSLLIDNTTDSYDILKHVFGPVDEPPSGGRYTRIPERIAIGRGASFPATSATLDVQGTDGAVLLPRLTTAQRDALTAADGMIIYNTTTGVVEAREGGAWVNV